MRKCNFCGKPILSETAYKIYHLVNNKAIDRKYKPLSCKEIARELNLSINVTENYLLRLVDVGLLRRSKEKYVYLYV